MVMVMVMVMYIREADLHAHVSCDRFNNLDFKPGSIAGAVQLVVSWAGCLLNGIFIDQEKRTP